MAVFRKSAGLVASLLILAIGTLNLRGNALPFGVAMLVLGIAGAVWQIRILRAARDNRYDLKRLFDEPYPGEDEPEVDALETGRLALPICHACGHAVAPSFARCPECGMQVR